MNTFKALDPCVFVIFGARGDLTRRMLVPALYNLAKEGLLPSQFTVVGVSRAGLSTEEFRKNMTQSVKEAIGSSGFDPNVWADLVRRLFYVSGDVKDIEFFKKFKNYLNNLNQEYKTNGNFLYYLAVPPDLFVPIIKYLAEMKLLIEENHHWRRIVIEKPFGNDLESAQSLNHTLEQVMRESQIFRIDHYLGKETVQNILIFRFANGIFEPIWNRRYIDSIQISVAETLGVEGRANYYEKSGALRDMVPNHLLQLLSLVAMEPPNSFSSDDVRNENVKILKAIKPLTPEGVLRQAVRGQYGPGGINGHVVPGYRSEPGVISNSETETFVALKLELDNWRWAGVPFYIRTGKRLKKRITEIVIQFRCAPFELFRETGVGPLPSNFLIMQIQPDEKISLSFTAKIPGAGIHLGKVMMEFDYADYFGHLPRTGYETLLYDCMKGDETLFRRADQVEQSWRVITPILEIWSALHPFDFPNYAAGSWGPAEADELLKEDGRTWHSLTL